MKKEVLSLSWDELKDNINKYMNENCKKEYIQEQALLFNDIYNYDGQGRKVIDIYIPDSAGQYISKEILEFFGFFVDENNYNDNISEYIETVDTVLYHVNNWLEDNIIIDDIYIIVELNGDFQLSAYYELDYDILEDESGRIQEESIIYRKKELEKSMLEVIEKCFIQGTDVNAETCLVEGYVSIWKNSYENKIMVYSFYCPDSKKFYYNTIPYQTKSDVFDLLKNVDPGFFSYVGITEEEVFKELEEEDSGLQFIQSMQQYYGELFYNMIEVDNIYELIENITGYDVY